MLGDHGWRRGANSVFQAALSLAWRNASANLLIGGTLNAASSGLAEHGLPVGEEMWCTIAIVDDMPRDTADVSHFNQRISSSWRLGLSG